jgi:hypothetical protein
MRLHHQHRVGSWTGVVEWSERFNIPAANEVPLAFSADTVADPLATLRAGDRLHFALRVDWENANGTPGCQMFLIEYYGTSGSEIGQTVLIVHVRGDIPDQLQQGLALPLCSR